MCWKVCTESVQTYNPSKVDTDSTSSLGALYSGVMWVEVCFCPPPESQDQNLALTVLHVPYSLDSGRSHDEGLSKKGMHPSCRVVHIWLTIFCQACESREGKRSGREGCYMGTSLKESAPPQDQGRALGIGLL